MEDTRVPVQVADTSSTPRLNVMTYNCLGLKFISHYRKERLSEIGRQISLLDPSPHIVGLQECWTQEDFLAIRSQTASILPYSKFYFSGMFGAGLAILSRYPIVEATMYPYPLNGRPTAFFRGDWFVGKGTAHARIRLPSSISKYLESTVSSVKENAKEALPTADLQSESRYREEHTYISVFSTHLHAPYAPDAHPNGYLAHRLTQSWFLAKQLSLASSRGDFVLAMGDINSLPLSLPHMIITSRGRVNDIWRTFHPDSSLGPTSHPAERERGRATPTALFNQIENGATSDSCWNTWRWSKAEQKAQYQSHHHYPSRKALSTQAEPSHLEHIPNDTPDPKGKRLDYIFYSSPPAQSQPQSVTFHPESAHVGMTQLHPTLNCSLSDHYSVHAIFTVHRSSASASPSPLPLPTSTPPPNPNPALTKTDLQTILNTTLPPMTRHSTRLSRICLSIFFLAYLLILPACAVGIWFIPHLLDSHLQHYQHNNIRSVRVGIGGIGFFLVMLSSLSIGVGTVAGLIGGVWCAWERRLLREWEWEVRNAIALLELEGEGEDGEEAEEKRAAA